MLYIDQAVRQFFFKRLVLIGVLAMKSGNV